MLHLHAPPASNPVIGVSAIKKKSRSRPRWVSSGPGILEAWNPGVPGYKERKAKAKIMIDASCKLFMGEPKEPPES